MPRCASLRSLLSPRVPQLNLFRITRAQSWPVGVAHADVVQPVVGVAQACVRDVSEKDRNPVVLVHLVAELCRLPEQNSQAQLLLVGAAAGELAVVQRKAEIGAEVEAVPDRQRPAQA